MPKFKDILRFDPKVINESNKQTAGQLAAQHAREKFGQTREAIIRVVNDNPGLSAKELQSHFEHKIVPTIYVKRKHIKAVVQDGKLRYYPKNYKFFADKAPKPVETKETKVEEPKITRKSETLAMEIEQLAREYMWDAGDSRDRHVLRKFVAWVGVNKK